MAVNVDFEELREKAGEMRSESEDLREIISNGEEILNSLVDNGFEGQTAQAFLDKYEDTKSDLESAAEFLDSVGEALDETADNFEEMDQELASSING